jgi:uncharacterized repeat protein (TIGR01451 family)
VAVNDSVTAANGVSHTISVLANDFDPDSDPIFIFSFTTPAHGSVFQSASNLVYQSATNYCGPDSFTYTISDNRGGFSNATVSITVTGCATNGGGTAIIQFVSNVYGRFEDQTAPLDVERLGDTNVGCSVQWSYTGGTAMPFSDFFGGSSTINFLPGQTIVALPISINDDAIAESDETAGFSLHSPFNATLGSPTLATLTIYDNDVSNPPPVTVVQFITDVYGRNENGGDAALTVTRSGNTSNACSVNWSVTGGSAGFPADYSPASGTLNFAAFETFKNISLVIVDDGLVESNETVNLTLSGAVNATIGFPSNAVLTIYDNDVAPSADLWITKTVNSNSVPVGQTVVFQLGLFNSGPSSLSNSITVNDAIPSGFQYVSDDSAGSGTTYSAGLGQWTIHNGVGAGSNIFLNITVQAINAGTYTNTASVIVPGGVTDPNTNNNSSRAVVTNTFPRADLQITKTASTNSVRMGQFVVFRLTLRNNGPGSFTNAFDVSDLLPTGFLFWSNVVSAGSDYSAGQGRWFVYNGLGSNEVLTLDITAQANVIGTYTNTARINVPVGITDPDTNNNSASVIVTNTPGIADLQITKSINTNNVQTNQPIVFSVTVHNLGPDTAADIVVRDYLPPGLIVLSSNVPHGTTYTSGTGVWNILSLASGASETLQLTTTRTTGGRVTNAVAITSAASTDTNSANNTNFVTAMWIAGPSADLEVRMIPGTNSVLAGDILFVELFVTNRGPNAPTNVTAKLTTDANVVISAVFGPFGGGTFDTNTRVLTVFGALPVNTYEQVNLHLRATTPGPHTLRWELISSGLPDPDSTPGDQVVGEDDQSDTNFTAIPTFTLSGSVCDCTTNGPKLTNVSVTISGTNIADQTINTGTNTTFVFSNLAAATYTITPAKPGYQFTPSNAVVALTTNRVTNFVATAYFVSGRVTHGTNGPPLPGVTILLGGAAIRTNVTDTNGLYIFTNLMAGNYTVRPLTNNPVIRFVPTNALVAISNVANCTNTANFIALFDVVELRALELVQVSQDWKNSVPLVAEKKTLVRAHLQLSGTNTTPVDVRGARLWATNLVTSASMSWAPENRSVLVRSNDASHASLRSNIATTLNFPLPDFWREGRIEYRFEWTNGVLLPREPAETGGTASNASVRVNYTNMPALGIRFVKVAWTNSVTNFIGPFPFVSIVTNIPTDAQIIEERRRVLALYPAVRFEVLNGYYFWSKANGAPTNEDNLVAGIEAARIASTDADPGDATNRIWYGVTVLPLTLTNRGQAMAIPARAAEGNVSRAADDYQRHLAAHELGHALGRHHAVNSGYATTAEGWKQGRCGEVAAAAAPDFPMVVRPVFGGALNLAPVLGPMSAPDDFIWGYYHLRNQVISPFFTYDLMSYCHGGDGSVTTPWPWTSKYTYTNLMNAIINRYGAKGAPPQAFHGRARSLSTHMLVRGSIRLADDFTTFQPCYPIVEGAVPTPEPGDYLLRIVDGVGLPLFEVSFSPTQPPVEGDAVPGSAYFHLEVPVFAAADGAILFHNGVPIGSLGASANAPVVQLLTPNGGEAFGGSGIRANWFGSDADGDPLHYLLQFSANSGLEWITVSIDLDGNELDIPPDVLAATAHGKLRVIASDGFRFSSDDSDGEFVILNSGPAVAIVSPTAGEMFFGEQSIVFSANANDLEDGALAGTNVVWRSDRDGLLGTSDLLLREVSTLSEGAHVITVTVTDSGGLTNAATVAINISHQELPQLHIVLDASDALLWWSLSATNYHLQRTLTLPGSWNDVTNAVELLDDRVQVRVPAIGPTRYFRLTKP